MNAKQRGGSDSTCVEHGVWTPVPLSPPSKTRGLALRYKDIDPVDHDLIRMTGRMTFHMVGCSGDSTNHQPQQRVADGMVAQLKDSDAGSNLSGHATTASFFYHLGDVIYKPGATSDVESDDVSEDATAGSEEDRGRMYNEQFYAPYAAYSRPIMAIAGNHDGTYSRHHRKSSIDHFLTNFCATGRRTSPDDATDRRVAMTQPYVYWRLNTPLARFIGLYSNISNGGILDDPREPEDGEQYQWFVSQLRDIRNKNAVHQQHKALILAVHYPPYSGAANFLQRGDPRQGPTGAAHARPLGTVLQQAFAESGQRPDVVVSAHAHLYERLTYRYADGWEIPYIVAGSGGHAPIENLFAACDGTIEPARTVPFDATVPGDGSIPAGDSIQVVGYNDQSFGFLRLTVWNGRIEGEFFTSDPKMLTCSDSFELDMTAHRILTAAGPP